MGQYKEKNYGGYTLFIGDNGFYLEDDHGTLVLDASRLDGTWPVELSIDRNRGYYVNANSNLGTIVEVGMGQRINNGNSN